VSEFIMAHMHVGDPGLSAKPMTAAVVGTLMRAADCVLGKRVPGLFHSSRLPCMPRVHGHDVRSLRGRAHALALLLVLN
jgi:hypothetical protein